MKTGFDLVDVLYDYLVGRGWISEISGSVYKYRRPLGSDREDVVINSLAIDGEQIQTGVTNINVYAPSIDETTNAGTEAMPNATRLKVLATLIANSLKDVWIGEYNFYVQQPPLLIEEENTGAFYFNIRIEWKNLNF